MIKPRLKNVSHIFIFIFIFCRLKHNLDENKIHAESFFFENMKKKKIVYLI